VRVWMYVLVDVGEDCLHVCVCECMCVCGYECEDFLCEHICIYMYTHTDVVT